jgi:acetoin utilization deacetylase AcuC-like enzyme
MANTAILLDRVYEKHTTGARHPECPQRYHAVARALDGLGILQSAPRVKARRATPDEIGLCHTLDYVQTVNNDIASGLHNLSTGDTAIGPDSLDVALEAVGGVLNAVDTVMSKTAGNAFCAVRPPGHHATSDRGMGFCIFNNVAIAARFAQKKHGVQRVMIVDWDVHHGNGTQEIFYRDPSVFFFSTHQYPWYPGTGRTEETGEGAGRNTTINCPLPAGSGREQIAGAFRAKLAPAADQYRPELVIISAGFDSRGGDPLGRFTLTDEDFAELTDLMLEVADKHAGGRLVSVLEGGYSLPGLAAGVSAHVGRLVQ